MRGSILRFVVVALIAFLMAPLSAGAVCTWGDFATPENIFAESCRRAGGCPSGCTCNPCGSTYRYTPPDPRVAALQRANQRMTDLLRRWKNDFQFASIDDWQSMDRSSEQAFLSFAERLDQAMIDQLNYFAEDLWRDQSRANSVAATDRAIAAYRHNIAVYDRYLSQHGPTAVAAKEEIALLAAQIRTFQSLGEEYRLKRDRNRLLAVAALSVYLPKRAVRVTPEILSRYEHIAPTRADGEVFPFGRKPPIIIPYPPGESALKPIYLSPVPAATPPAKYGYRPLPGTPEEAVALLERDEQRAVKAFRDRNDYDKAHPEIFEEERKSAELARLGRLHGEKKARTEEISGLDEQSGIFPKLHAAREKVQGAAATMINRAAESLVWELTKNTAIDLAKKVGADKTHAKLTKLYLGEDQILDKYEGHLYNIFSLPEVVFKARDLKAVQNDMLTLLKQDQLYAKTAVRLAASGDPTEIRTFVDGMFDRLDQDATRLVDDALSASSTLPEPVRTLASRYFSRSFRDKSDVR